MHIEFLSFVLFLATAIAMTALFGNLVRDYVLQRGRVSMHPHIYNALALILLLCGLIIIGAVEKLEFSLFGVVALSCAVLSYAFQLHQQHAQHKRERGRATTHN